MESVTKIHKSEILANLQGENTGVLCNVSFEERCRVIPSKLAKHESIHSVMFQVISDCDAIESNGQYLEREFKGRAKVLRVESSSPFAWSNIISDAIGLLHIAEVEHLLIDVTTFTHEALLILLKTFRKSTQKFSSVKLLYLGATEYNPGEKTPENKWLSKGCRDVRSVLGYPGWMKPGFPTCLTVLVGFEHERATRIIAEMEPELLLLGGGSSSTEDLIHKNHKAPMLHFKELVREMTSTRYNVKEFEFSCSKPVETENILKEIIESYPLYNHVIVPLNTKISTTAVANFALANPNVQICYAEPETYNSEDYAVAGEMVTILPISLES
jgi:hypothetical protein